MTHCFIGYVTGQAVTLPFVGLLCMGGSPCQSCTSLHASLCSAGSMSGRVSVPVSGMLALEASPTFSFCERLSLFAAFEAAPSLSIPDSSESDSSSNFLLPRARSPRPPPSLVRPVSPELHPTILRFIFCSVRAINVCARARFVPARARSTCAWLIS